MGLNNNWGVVKIYGLLEQIVSMKLKTMYNVYAYSVYKMVVYSLKYDYLKTDEIIMYILNFDKSEHHH